MSPTLLVAAALVLGLGIGWGVFRLLWPRPSKAKDPDTAKALLLAGKIEEWNEFRTLNSNWKPNLYGMNLEGRNLDGVDLRLAILRKAVLAEASLEGADLTGSNIEEADLRNANLKYALLDHAFVSEADLTGAKLDGTSFAGVELGKAKGVSADARGGAELDWRVSLEELQLTQFAKDPTRLSELNPREFEQLVAQLFSALGFVVRSTPPTQDGGYDLLVSKSVAPGMDAEYIVEVKRYTRPVGAATVHALIGVVARTGSAGGFLVTTNKFTKQAQMMANERRHIRLIDGSALTALFTQYADEALTSEA